MIAWGQLEPYDITSLGGSGTRFEMNFGNGRAQAFIDVVASSWEDKTFVEVLIRVVE